MKSTNLVKRWGQLTLMEKLTTILLLVAFAALSIEISKLLF